MANYGKIARLPREIRDELNRRFDSGETGVRVLDWLNGLPEVKQMLERDFEGREINEVNLSDWRNGGYQEWKMQKDMLVQVQEFKADSKELVIVSGSGLTECMANVLAVRYATLLRGWDGEISNEMRGKLRALRGLSREVSRMRRGEREMERVKLEREWLELGQRKSDEGIKKRMYELCEDHDFQSKITPKISDRERARRLRKVLFPDKEEPKRTRIEAKSDGKENQSTAQKSSPEAQPSRGSS